MITNNFLNTMKRLIARSAKKIGRFVQYWGEDVDATMDRRVKVLEDIGVHIGDNAAVWNISVDPIYPELISIGNNVTITHATILTHDDSSIIFTNRRRVGPVCIGDNVFIGYGSLILPGVTIGNNCIIGAGSVVTRDVPDNSIAVGIPARVIKSMPEHIKRLNADISLLDFCVASNRITNDEHEAMRLEVLKKYHPDLLIPPKQVNR